MTIIMFLTGFILFGLIGVAIVYVMNQTFKNKGR